MTDVVVVVVFLFLHQINNNNVFGQRNIFKLEIIMLNLNEHLMHYENN